MDIENYIKWCLIQLSVNVSIERRNYCSKQTMTSPLEQYILNSNGSFDQGIALLAKSIEPKLILTFTEYKNEYDEDELEAEIFNIFVTISGLYEINSLHGDSIDVFQSKFKVLVYTNLLAFR